MKKKIAVFLFEGFSDWEIAYLTPEINKSEGFEMVYFSTSGDLVTSMGGLQVKPAKALKDLAIEDLEMLILPGGTTWEKGGNKEIGPITKDMLEAGKTVAAICAATIYLGQVGLLNNLKHTSSDLNYLKAMAPEYTGGDLYQNALAVTDGNLITANGIAPIEFAREVFKAIGLYGEEAIEKWFQLFKNGVWSE
ncbi:MAG: glutamine amidotransferase [Bacteroidales bacterium]|nr:glutamine amidotransferase [Bacteroidales bacterium]